MAKTQVIIRYFVKPKPPLTFGDLAQWLNQGGESADTQATTTLGVGGRSVGEALEITEDRVFQLKQGGYCDKVHVFMKYKSGHPTAHPCFVPWS